MNGCEDECDDGRVDFDRSKGGSLGFQLDGWLGGWMRRGGSNAGWDRDWLVEERNGRRVEGGWHHGL